MLIIRLYMRLSRDLPPCAPQSDRSTTRARIVAAMISHTPGPPALVVARFGWCAENEVNPMFEDDDDGDLRRGGSDCEGMCVPTCKWCVVGHVCPDQCGGGEECPYDQLIKEEPE